MGQLVKVTLGSSLQGSWRALIGAALLLLFACKTTGLRGAIVRLERAPASVAGLRVFVGQTKTIIRPGHDAEKCVPLREQQDTDALRSALIGAGYSVVGSGPRDLEVTLTSDIDTQDELCGTEGPRRLAAIAADGRFLFERADGAPYQYMEMPDVHWAESFVNALSHAPAILELGASAPAAATPTPIAVAPKAPPVGAAAAAQAPPALKAGVPQRTAYAVIVGIDRYRDLPAATGARADAEHMASLLRMTFGIPDANIRVAVDDRATRSDVLQALSWLAKNVPSGGRAYFFYSGHGSPDVGTGSPLLVPYDANPQAIAETAVPLESIYKQLSSTKAKDAIALVDACFSGAGGRSVLPEGARPLVLLKEPVPTASLSIFTAAGGTETSGPAASGGEGAFTKLVLEGLGTAQADIDGDGQITLAELAEWVSPRVANEARKSSREQHPKLAVGAGVGDAKDVALVWGVR